MKLLSPLIVFASLFLVTSINATTIISHAGQVDPLSQGWTNSIGTLPNGPINDSGIEAWTIDDNSTTAAGGFKYVLSSTEADDASMNGWRLSANLLVQNTDPTGQATIALLYGTDTTRFDLWFTTETVGDPTVMLANAAGVAGGLTGGTQVGSTFTLTGAANTYNLFELVFDPTEGTADLFVNGIEQLSNYAGWSFSGPGVFFGGGSSLRVGEGRFNSVEFSTFDAVMMPAPNILSLFFIGIIGIVFNLKR